MFCYELKKIIKIKGIKISILVLLLTMLLSAVNNTGILNKYNSEILTDEDLERMDYYQKKLIDEYEGTEYSEELYKEMLLVYQDLYELSESTVNEGDEIGEYGPTKKYDRNVYMALIERMEYLKIIHDDLAGTIEETNRAIENNNDLGKYMNEYKGKELLLALDDYQYILDNTSFEISYTSSAYWYVFCNSEDINDFNYLLIIIFTCCIVTIYYTSEYEEKMNQLTYTSLNGRARMFVVKNAVVMLISLLITVFSSLINALTLSLYYGNITSMFDTPIQILYETDCGAIAEFCPFHITFGQYILLAAFMEFTAIYFVAVVCMFFSSWLQNGMGAIVTGVSINAGLLQLAIYASQKNLSIYETESESLNNLFDVLKTFSPVTLLWSRDYINAFDTANVFGTPIHRIYVAIIFSWLVIVIISVAGGYMYCRRRKYYGIGIKGYFKKIWKKRSIA